VSGTRSWGGYLLSYFYLYMYHDVAAWYYWRGGKCVSPGNEACIEVGEGGITCFGVVYYHFTAGRRGVSVVHILVVLFWRWETHALSRNSHLPLISTLGRRRGEKKLYHG